MKKINMEDNKMKIELEKEYNYYKTHKEEWLKDRENQFVLIKDEKVLGFFARFEDAFNRGIEMFGKPPFFIHQIVKEERIEDIPALRLGVINAYI